MENVMKKILRSNKGQSLVELTMVAPLMILMTFGVIEVGQIISVYLGLTQTTREGANLVSRGEDPSVALDTVVTASAPSIRTNNQNQWKIIYTKITQKPGIPCPPPQPCTYEVSQQITRGNYNQTSQIGRIKDVVTLPGINNVKAGQIFHTMEAFYDYGPNVVTFVGNGLNKNFYDRTIFTDVSGR